MPAARRAATGATPQPIGRSQPGACVAVTPADASRVISSGVTAQRWAIVTSGASQPHSSSRSIGRRPYFSRAIVGLRSAAQPVPLGHLAEQPERLLAVAVHPGRTDGELQHPVVRDAAVCVAHEVGDDAFRREGSLLGVVAGGASHEDQAPAQLGGRRRRGAGEP